MFYLIFNILVLFHEWNKMERRDARVKKARACSLINAKHMHPFSFAERRTRFSDEERTEREALLACWLRENAS